MQNWGHNGIFTNHDLWEIIIWCYWERVFLGRKLSYSCITWRDGNGKKENWYLRCSYVRSYDAALDLFDWYAGTDIWGGEAFFLPSSISMIIVDSLSRLEAKNAMVSMVQRVKMAKEILVRVRGGNNKTECAILNRKGANVNGSPRGNKRDS